MASRFDDLIKAVLECVKELAKEIFNGYEEEANKDTTAFIKKTEADLKRWIKLLVDRKLTKQDFNDLVLAKKALAEIHALTQAGIALTKLERFRTSLINLVIDKTFEIFL